MNIALLLATSGTGWGGMERHTADLAGALARSGHSVHVLAHGDYAGRFLPPVMFHPFPMQLGRRNPWLRWRIARALKAIQPDVAHAHGNKAVHLLSKIRPHRWQTVGTVHGTKTDLSAFQRLDKVIAVSQSAFDRLDHPARFRVANGVEINTMAASPPDHWLQASPDHTVIQVVAAGRLEPVKGFDTLIDAWAQITAEHSNARLTIFGEGSMKAALDQQIRAAELADRITLAGHYPNLPGLFKQAHALVISSQREGFPYTLIEALQAGCPVLSTPVAGATELLPQNAIAADTSASALAALLNDSLHRLDPLRTEQKPTFELARQHLTLEAMTASTLKVYQSPRTGGDG